MVNKLKYNANIILNTTLNYESYIENTSKESIKINKKLDNLNI